MTARFPQSLIQLAVRAVFDCPPEEVPAADFQAWAATAENILTATVPALLAGGYSTATAAMHLAAYLQDRGIELAPGGLAKQVEYVGEEYDELRDAVEAGDQSAIKKEIGDLYLALAGTAERAQTTVEDCVAFARATDVGRGDAKQEARPGTVARANLRLDPYLRDNLLALLLAVSGHAGRSPLQVGNTGDWVMMLVSQLAPAGPPGEQGRPNRTAEQLVDAANMATTQREDFGTRLREAQAIKAQIAAMDPEVSVREFFRTAQERIQQRYLINRAERDHIRSMLDLLRPPGVTGESAKAVILEAIDDRMLTLRREQGVAAPVDEAADLAARARQAQVVRVQINGLGADFARTGPEFLEAVWLTFRRSAYQYQPEVAHLIGLLERIPVTEADSWAARDLILDAIDSRVAELGRQRSA
jgi:hypothetical protein